MSRVTYQGFLPVCHRCGRQFSGGAIWNLVIGNSTACAGCGARHKVVTHSMEIRASRWRLLAYVGAGAILGSLFDDKVAFVILVAGLLFVGLRSIFKRLGRLEVEPA